MCSRVGEDNIPAQAAVQVKRSHGGKAGWIRHSPGTVEKTPAAPPDVTEKATNESLRYVNRCEWAVKYTRKTDLPFHIVGGGIPAKALGVWRIKDRWLIGSLNRRVPGCESGVENTAILVQRHSRRLIAIQVMRPRKCDGCWIVGQHSHIRQELRNRTGRSGSETELSVNILWLQIEPANLLVWDYGGDERCIKIMIVARECHFPRIWSNRGGTAEVAGSRIYRNDAVTKVAGKTRHTGVD